MMAHARGREYVGWIMMCGERNTAVEEPVT
jgi:hypothetical protein